MNGAVTVVAARCNAITTKMLGVARGRGGGVCRGPHNIDKNILIQGLHRGALLASSAPAVDSLPPTIHSQQQQHFSTNTQQEDIKKQLEQERREILKEAKSLTLLSFRNALRSVKAIAKGNQNDKDELAERERKRKEDLNKKNTDIRLSMISMLPAGNYKDELKSRAEYYTQYARETFYSEADCLDHENLDRSHIERYLHHLRQSEEHRKWLLSDMKFDDPVVDGKFDHDRIDAFEQRALDHTQKVQNYLLQQQMPNDDYSISYTDTRSSEEDAAANEEQEEDVDDFWSSDEDEDDDPPAHLPPLSRRPPGF